MRTKLRGKVTLLFLILGLLLAIPAVALADVIVNDIDSAGDNTITAGNSTTIGYKINAQGPNPTPQDPQGGCNASDGSPLKLTLSVPSGVTASGTDLGAGNVLTFTSCGTFKNVAFTSNTSGNYAINTSYSDTGTGSYTNNSSFTLIVNDNCPAGDNSGNPQDGTCAAPVTNHAPTVSTDAGNVSGDEGSELTNSGGFSDEDADPLTITKQSGSVGTVHDNGNGTWSWSHTPDDNGSATVVVEATDGTDTATDSFTWTANNVAPTVSSVSASVQNALVNKNVTFTGTATDPSSVDTTAGFSWQWSKDGGAYAAGSNPFSTSFADCGSHSVSAKATDKDNGTSAAVSSGNVNVYNASFAPPVDIAPYVNTVQKGRVIPVKISVSCNGNIANLSPSIQLLTGDKTEGNETTADEVETYSVSSADTGQVMRTIDGGYIYNLRVPDVANAYYTVRVNPFGGSNASSNMYALLKTRK
jgi:hypothetical protein